MKSKNQKIKMPKINPAVSNVEYVKDYTIKITFDNGHQNVIDYSDYILNGHSEAEKYRDVEKFKNDVIIDYDIVAWGENWDMCFSFKTIYSKPKAWEKKAEQNKVGRPKSDDKKEPVRIMVHGSIIKKYGGMDGIKKFLLDCL